MVHFQEEIKEMDEELEIELPDGVDVKECLVLMQPLEDLAKQEGVLTASDTAKRQQPEAMIDPVKNILYTGLDENTSIAEDIKALSAQRRKTSRKRQTSPPPEFVDDELLEPGDYDPLSLSPAAKKIRLTPSKPLPPQQQQPYKATRRNLSAATIKMNELQAQSTRNEAILARGHRIEDYRPSWLTGRLFFVPL